MSVSSALLPSPTTKEPLHPSRFLDSWKAAAYNPALISNVRHHGKHSQRTFVLWSMRTRTKSQWHTRNVLSARFAAFSPKPNIDRPLCTTLKYEPLHTMGFFCRRLRTYRYTIQNGFGFGNERVPPLYPSKENERS